jgi:type III secretory pathway component EscU
MAILQHLLELPLFIEAYLSPNSKLSKSILKVFLLQGLILEFIYSGYAPFSWYIWGYETTCKKNISLIQLPRALN